MLVCTCSNEIQGEKKSQKCNYHASDTDKPNHSGRSSDFFCRASLNSRCELAGVALCYEASTERAVVDIASVVGQQVR